MQSVQVNIPQWLRLHLGASFFLGMTGRGPRRSLWRPLSQSPGPPQAGEPTARPNSVGSPSLGASFSFRAGPASVFAWDPSGFAKSTRLHGDSPATIDLMPAHGVVAYGNRQRRHFPRHLHWRGKGASAGTTATGAPTCLNATGFPPSFSHDHVLLRRSLRPPYAPQEPRRVDEPSPSSTLHQASSISTFRWSTAVTTASG